MSTLTFITENLTSNFFRRLVFSVISVYDRKKLVLKNLPEANFTEKKKDKPWKGRKDEDISNVKKYQVEIFNDSFQEMGIRWTRNKSVY